MTALFLFKEKARELQEYARKNAGLATEFDLQEYPIKISFTEGGEQMSLFDADAAQEERGTPCLRFIYAATVKIVTRENFEISEEIFNKLKTLSKEVNRLYLNAFCEKFNSLRLDMRELGWVDQIGELKTNCDGKPYCLAVANPLALKAACDELNIKIFD